jgi:hypothetical protein
VRVEREQRVAEARRADGVDVVRSMRLLECLPCRADERIGIGLTRVVAASRVSRFFGRSVEHMRAHGGGSDVEGEHARHAAEP